MNIFEKLKKIIIAYIANNFKLSNKLTKVKNHLDFKLVELDSKLTEIKRIQKDFIQIQIQNLKSLEKQIQLRFSSLDSKVQNLFIKSMENEIFALRDSLLPLKKITICKNHFLLFHYNKHTPKYSHHNLGDFIQSIATKNALLSLNPKATFEFFDRDSLISYYPAGGGGQIAL